MAISINWGTKVITIPQADLTFVSGTLYELDVNQFRLDLKALEDDEEGIWALDTHRHNADETIAGTTFPDQVIIINGYTVTFEDGQYAVRLINANNNLFDEGIINRNQVSIIPTNSAGLAYQQNVLDMQKIIDPKKHVIDANSRTIYEEDGVTVFRQWSTEDKDGNVVILGVGDPALEER